MKSLMLIPVLLLLNMYDGRCADPDLSDDNDSGTESGSLTPKSNRKLDFVKVDGYQAIPDSLSSVTIKANFPKLGLGQHSYERGRAIVKAQRADKTDKDITLEFVFKRVFNDPRPLSCKSKACALTAFSPDAWPDKLTFQYMLSDKGAFGCMPAPENNQEIHIEFSVNGKLKRLFDSKNRDIEMDSLILRDIGVLSTFGTNNEGIEGAWTHKNSFNLSLGSIGASNITMDTDNFTFESEFSEDN